jgi:hypothetical protein
MWKFTAVLVVFATLFLLCLANTLLGAFSGWIVGLVFSDTILGFLSRIGVDTQNLSMWQIGAALGFIGSFFRTQQIKSNEK